MTNRFHWLLLPALLLPGCGRAAAQTGPAQPVTLQKAAAASAAAEIEKERAENREWLRRDPQSYLAAVDRVDFGESSSLTVGGAADNQVHLSATGIEPHHLRISVVGDRFHIQALDSDARFKIKDEVEREATVGPSAIQVGRFTLRLSHQRFPAIVVFDPQSPRLKEYKGIDYFPIDFSYRYELPLIRYSQPEKITIVSTRGNRRSAERVGWVSLWIGETACRLEVTRLLEPGTGENDLSIYFCDATNGKESYPLGRYVDLRKLKNGNYLLDFNEAYNPACAFSDYYNCPIPPKSNRLTVAIRAGEKDSHYSHH